MRRAILLVIGARVLGMYVLVLVVGTVIDRFGRPVALACDLPALAAAATYSTRSASPTWASARGRSSPLLWLATRTSLVLL
jgi:hypothetical protein